MTPLKVAHQMRNMPGVFWQKIQHGGCYRFARLLSLIFPAGEIWVDRDSWHVVLKLGSKFYDVEGVVKDVGFEKMSKAEMRRAERWE